MTTEQKSYQVTAPMIQLTGPHAAGSAFASGYETVFRKDDLLPSWIKPDDAKRLVAEGLIQELGA